MEVGTNPELGLSEVLLVAERGSESGKQRQGEDGKESQAGLTTADSAPLPSPGDTVAQEDLWNRFSNCVRIQAWGGEEIRRQCKRDADLAWRTG